MENKKNELSVFNYSSQGTSFKLGEYNRLASINVTIQKLCKIQLVICYRIPMQTQ